MTHVEGDVDPVRDMEIIHEELRLKDLEYLDKTIDHMERVVIRGGDKSRKAEYVRCFTELLSICQKNFLCYEFILVLHNIITEVSTYSWKIVTEVIIKCFLVII